MQKILIVVGTRPEAIKMAPLISRLQATAGFDLRICSTGQHKEMIRQVFELFSIEPDIDLDVMQANQNLSGLTARVLTGMEDVIRDGGFRRVLVHGDTTTTMATTLAAYYQKIPVGHVEAGLRTDNIYSPWPEEINRRVTDTIADRLYAPTSRARDNLLREGARESQIVVTGNTVIDALFDVLSGPLSDPDRRSVLEERFSFLDPRKKILLVTCHRRESFGTGLQDICAALSSLASRPDVQIVFPVHRNPNVRSGFAALQGLSNVILTEPLDYLEFVFMLSKSHLILTDSGGIQEEAPSLGKPVLVLRPVTERPEAIEAGTVKLVGTDTTTIIEQSIRLLENASEYEAMTAVHNPYGDGKACERIIASLREDG